MAELESEKEKGKSMSTKNNIAIATVQCLICGAEQTAFKYYDEPGIPKQLRCVKCRNRSSAYHIIEVHKSVVNRPIDNFRMASYGKP